MGEGSTNPNSQLFFVVVVEISLQLHALMLMIIITVNTIIPLSLKAKDQPTAQWAEMTVDKHSLISDELFVNLFPWWVPTQFQIHGQHSQPSLTSLGQGFIHACGCNMICHLHVFVHVHVCMVVIWHLLFWQNDWDNLREAVTVMLQSNTGLERHQFYKTLKHT